MYVAASTLGSFPCTSPLPPVSPISPALTSPSQTDEECRGHLRNWDGSIREESRRVCSAIGFVTGFLEEEGGTHALMDAYELKVCG